MTSQARSFHAARWDEPIIMTEGSPGERGLIPRALEPGLADAVGPVDELLPASIRRSAPPALPELSQPQVLRHFLRLSQMTLGAHLTPDASLGTCTMKYSPAVNEAIGRSAKVSELHPDQPDDTVQGLLEIVHRFGRILAEISGLDEFSFQSGSGTHGVFANACIIREAHRAAGEYPARREIITTAFSHPANAAAAAVAGFDVITLMPGPRGYPEVDALKAALSERTAGLLITNPEDTGIFNPHIETFTRLVHEAGGLCAYDQANANGILGVTRARESGFDLCQFNLHKTFSSPHASVGSASGGVGATAALAPFLPAPIVVERDGRFMFDHDRPSSIGKVRSFHGNLQAVVRAYAWVRSLGGEGLHDVATTAVLNNNYLAAQIGRLPGVTIPYPDGGGRLEQVRYSAEALFEETGVSTADLWRRMVDYGLQGHTTSHHPMLVAEPFTLEPSESWSQRDLDEYVAVYKTLIDEARDEPEVVQTAPHRASVHRVDEEAIDDPDRWAMTWRAHVRKRQAREEAAAEGR